MLVVVALLGETVGALTGMAVFGFLAYRGIYIPLMHHDYVLLFGTAGGEIDVLTSKDGGFVGQVVEAINEAIIARG